MSPVSPSSFLPCSVASSRPHYLKAENQVLKSYQRVERSADAAH
jgi:hypothetical protein